MSKHNTMNETHEQTGIELVKAGHSLQFEGISGYTLIKCEKSAKGEDKTITVPALSMTYQAHVADAVCGCKVDDIYSLPAADFTRVCLEVQNFLLNSEK